MSLRVTRQYVDALGTGAGKARVTRQFADVLGRGDGKFRVTRQYVDVLGSAVEGVNYEESVASNLQLAQTIVAGLNKYASVTSTLDFSDEISADLTHLVTHTLELTQTAVGVRDIPRSVTHTLGFTQEAVWIGPHYIDVFHFIPLQQDPYGHLAVINVWVNQELDLSQSFGRTIYASVSHQLNLSIVGWKRNSVVHTLALTQTISVGKFKQITTPLNLAQTLHVQGVFYRQVNHDLGLVHAGAYESLSGDCLKKQYEPQLGFTTDTSVSMPSGSAPSLSEDTLTLTYPYVSPTVTVALRNPEFNNKDTLTFNRINRMTRGGTLIVFADPNWPKVQKLSVEIQSLTPPQADALLDFFEQSLGKEIGLADHEGRQWRGIIVNPDAPVSNPGRGDYSASFEFEGELC